MRARDAGTAELEELARSAKRCGAMTEQSFEIIFPRGIEAAIGFRDSLAEQAIGADHFARPVGDVVDRKQMIAQRIIAIRVERGVIEAIAAGAQLLEEDLVAQGLRRQDVRFGGRETNLDPAGLRQR